MTTADFLLRYWKYYIQIEKEFVETINYFSIDESNFNTYSDAYMKIMLQIGSEIDITCKLLCELLGEKLKDGSIYKYKSIILNHIPGFCDVRIIEKLSEYNTCPWEEWRYENRVPTWWTIYNKVKHHRISVGAIHDVKQEYYKFANQKYTLMALMGLYQVMLYSYYFLSQKENKTVFVPLPASRLFETNSSIWKDVDLGTNSVMYINNETGHLIIETGLFEY